MQKKKSVLLMFFLATMACGPNVAGVPVEDDASTSTGRPSTVGGTTDDDPLPQTSSTASTSTTSGDAPTTSGTDTSGTTLEVVELRIEPPFAILDSGEGGFSREFEAIAVLDDGSEVVVTTDADWTLDGPGDLDDGVLTSPTSEVPIFERSELSASFDGQVAVAYAAISVRTLEPGAPQMFNLSHATEPRPIVYETSLDKVDVFFLFNTVNFGQSHMPAIGDVVATTAIPFLQEHVADLRVGAGEYASFPVEPLGVPSCEGGGSDTPFELWTEVTDDLVAFDESITTLQSLPLGCTDTPSAGGEALYQIATGEGLDGPTPTSVAANPGSRGGVGFRDDALAVIVGIHRNDQQRSFRDGCIGYEPPISDFAHGGDETREALLEHDILHIPFGPQYGDYEQCGFSSFVIDSAFETGARIPDVAWLHPQMGQPQHCDPGECCISQSPFSPGWDEVSEQCPLAVTSVATVDGYDEYFVRMFWAMLNFLQTDLSVTVGGESSATSGERIDGGTTTADFVQIEFSEFEDSPHAAMPLPIQDGLSFNAIGPGQGLRYSVGVDDDVVPRAEGKPLLFRARIDFETAYRTGSRAQEIWMIAPPAAVQE